MSSFDWLVRELEELKAGGLAREANDGGVRLEVIGCGEVEGRQFVDASSNDYLGYAAFGVGGRGGWCQGLSGSRDILSGGAEPVGGDRSAHTEAYDVSRETLTTLSNRAGGRNVASTANLPNEFPASPGAGASRLLGGTRPEHLALEGALAEWVGQDSALLFSSGYAANLGLLSSLAQRGDTVFSDALNHASIIDGCRLSAAEILVYPHLDLDILATILRQHRTSGRRFIVSESYFSMDADSPKLTELRALADNFDATLIVDEAHALGIFGPKGAGLAQQQGVLPDITVGTLAIGLQGAFVAGPSVLRSWLWNRARSFVYSTATTPRLAHQTLLHVKHIQENESARERLTHLTDRVRASVVAHGYTVTPRSHGPIIPILIGNVQRAIDAAAALRTKGVLAYAIRPPTVAKDSARLRLTINATMSDAAVAHLIDSLVRSLPPNHRT